MASTSAAPMGNEGEFGKLTLPPLSFDKIADSEFEGFLPSKLSISLRAIGVSQENIETYTKTLREDAYTARMSGFLNPIIYGKESTVSLPLPDITDVPINDITDDTVYQATYVLRCFLALGGDKKTIFNYLVRQFDLLCQKNDAHRHDAAVLFTRLALLALERICHSSADAEHARWMGKLAFSLDSILVMARKTSVNAPFVIDDTDRKELCRILRKLWSASKEEAALFYAGVSWVVYRNIPERDNPVLHPSCIFTKQQKRKILQEFAEVANKTNSFQHRADTMKKYSLSVSTQDFLGNEKLYEWEIHASVAADIFYNSDTSLLLVSEDRFAPLSEEAYTQQ
ncbi:MAG: hypothetical protein ABW189_09495 [Rickettsiales bacterium]